MSDLFPKSLVALVAALVVAQAGCEESAKIEISVDVRTDLMSGTDFDNVLTEIALHPLTQDNARRTATLEDTRDMTFVNGVRVAEFSKLERGHWYVRVSLRQGDATALEQTADAVADDSYGFLFAFSKACLGVACDGGTSCVSGVCVGADQDGGTCEDNTQCVNALGNDCVRAECVQGMCLCLCEADSGMPCDAEECANGVDDDADGFTDCEDSECDAFACSDGNACTLNDVCSDGACVGEPKECAQPAGSCQSVSCNTTSGECEMKTKDDGDPCSDAHRCCDGTCVDLTTDRNHCGGCGLACTGDFQCVVSDGQPSCDCGSSNTECPGGQVCSDVYSVCACNDGSNCTEPEACVDREGPNYCAYP